MPCVPRSAGTPSLTGLLTVLAYAVAQRTSEIDLRMALGARQSQVLTLILRQSMRLVLIGLAAGLVTAAVGGRFIRSLLFQIEPWDPVVFTGMGTLFALVGVLACLLPSLRAARVNPIVALREG